MSKNSETAISVKHVSKRFMLPHEKTASIKSVVVNVFQKKNRTVEIQSALKDISFEIKKGEFFGILGRNGSGKSTLLKILAEIYKPTTGKVSVHGKLVPFIELGVGFNPELTGRENVYLNGALLGFSKKEIDERYNDIVKFAELEDFMDQKLKNYSSGMQVRLAFSVATRAEADILLVDEVLAVGDADFQRKCYDYFKSLKKTGKTVVFVTHDMNAAREYCDRALLIEDGVIVEHGSVRKVADHYLRLFNPDGEDDEEESSSGRWGSRAVSFASLKAFVSSEEIILEAVIKSKIDADNVVVGLRLNDLDGALLAGLSSRERLKGPIAVKAGESLTLSYSIPNNLGRKQVFLGGTVALSDGVTVYDNWDNAKRLNNPNEKSYYPITYDQIPEIKYNTK